MAKKILIFGRTGAGKTDLANALAPLIGATVFDGDVVRNLDPITLGFTAHERWQQAHRMGGLCDLVTASGNNAIAAFVCPLRTHRDAFNADFTIWMDRNGDQKYADTNAMFEEPNPALIDLRAHNGQSPQYWAQTAADMVQSVFQPLRKTALFIGRYQPFHDGHRALIVEGIKRHGQVCIGVRDQNREWPFERVKQLADFKLREYVGRYSIISLPNVTAVCYGRDVGYDIERISLPTDIEKISGTTLRELADGNVQDSSGHWINARSS